MKESHPLPSSPEPAQGFAGLAALFNELREPQTQPQPQPKPSIEQCIDPPWRWRAPHGAWTAASQDAAVSQHNPGFAIDKDHALPASPSSQKLLGRQSPWTSTCIPWRASRGFCVMQSVDLGLKYFQAPHPGQLRRRMGAWLGLVLIVASLVAGIGGLLSQEHRIAEQEAKLVGVFATGPHHVADMAPLGASQLEPAPPSPMTDAPADTAHAQSLTSLRLVAQTHSAASALRQEVPAERTSSAEALHHDDQLERVSPLNALAGPPSVAGFLPATALVRPLPGPAIKHHASEWPPRWWCLLGPDNQCVPM